MKYIFLSIAFLLAALTGIAQSGSYENDFRQIKNSIINYLSNTAKNVRRGGAVGAKESNSCLCEAMGTRAMYRLADPLDEYVFYSQLGSKFYQVFYTFSLQNQAAFKAPVATEGEEVALHFSHDYCKCPQCYANQLEEAGSHILNIFLQKEVTAPLERELRHDVHAMLHSPYHITENCDLSGNVTLGVHNAALEALLQLEAMRIRNPRSAAGRMEIVMLHFFDELLDLPVQEKDTRLSAEWQTGYYTILYATYMELQHMDTYPSSVAYLDYATKYKHLHNSGAE
jgi:hypothetical protein